MRADKPPSGPDGLFRCGVPEKSLKNWLASQAADGLRIATYGLSAYSRLGHYLPREARVELLVGVSGIDPVKCRGLNDTPAHLRWQRLLPRLDPDEQKHLLNFLSRMSGWHYAGATIRATLPGQASGLMHAKVYLAQKAALIGSVNFTVQAV